MEVNRENIEVSVIVPVYNSGKHLRTCLDSLITQNFENYEIVLVNNGSTDESADILSEYSEKYPEKVFVYSIEHSDFVGTGRNYGLSKARGKYVYMCDSDDIVERNALLFMHGRMKRYNLDVVYGTVEFVNCQSNTRFMLQSDGEREVSIAELILSGAEFWRRMFRKSLLDEIGPMPENTCFDDIAWLPVVHSYAKKAMSTERKIYNYFRRTSSTVGGTSKKVIEQTVISEKYAVENCNPEYKEQVLMFVAKRILGNIKSRWEYKDILVEEIGYFWEQFKNCQCILDDIKLYEELEMYYKIYCNMIPKRVYIPESNNESVVEHKEKIENVGFPNGDCEIIVCDNKYLSRKFDLTPYSKFIKMAEQENQKDLLYSFYGLLNVYENGGIYIHPNVSMNTVLYSLRCNGSFFSFLDKNTYSDWIFGGSKGNEVLGKVLETFRGDGYYKDILYPMNLRIKNILTVLYEVPLKGEFYQRGELLTVYSPEVLVINPYKCIGSVTTVQMCEHTFIDDNSDEYITVKKSTLSWMIKSGICNAGSSNQIQKSLDNISMTDYQNIKRRIEAIEGSDAMKMALWLYKMGNKFTLPKKIVKKMLNK